MDLVSKEQIRKLIKDIQLKDLNDEHRILFSQKISCSKSMHQIIDRFNEENSTR